MKYVKDYNSCKEKGFLRKLWESSTVCVIPNMRSPWKWWACDKMCYTIDSDDLNIFDVNMCREKGILDKIWGSIVTCVPSHTYEPWKWWDCEDICYLKPPKINDKKI